MEFDEVSFIVERGAAVAQSGDLAEAGLEDVRVTAASRRGLLVWLSVVLARAARIAAAGRRALFGLLRREG